MELETPIPLALERNAPVVIDVPFGEMPIPRAPQIAFVYNLPLDDSPGRADSVLSRTCLTMTSRPIHMKPPSNIQVER